MNRARRPPVQLSLTPAFDHAVGSLCAALHPDTTRHYRGTVRNFLGYLNTAYPAITSLDLLRRDPHILGWMSHLRAQVPPLVTASYINLLLALRRIRREKYDVVIDAEFFSRLSGLVSYFVRARYSVGFYLPEIWRGNFLTHPVHFNYYRHAILAFMALAKSLGVESADYELEPLVISSEIERSVRAKLQTMGILPGQRVICVNVNTGPLSPERRWPEQSFAKLIASVLSEFPEVVVLLIGAPSELPLVAKMHSLVGSDNQGRVLNVAGKFSLPELCGLFRTSELLITNDSGPLHLAEALAVPTVSFFGPETPLLYGPTGDSHVVFYKGIYCSPCLNVHNQKKAPCNGNNVCMKLISPDEVFASTKMLLRGLRVSSPFRVAFDVSVKDLLTDYHTLPLVSSAPNAVPVSVLSEK